MKTTIIRLLLLILLMSVSCGDNSTESVQTPDYSDDYNWASNPSVADKGVDVFYVYPTLFGGRENKNMDITDDQMRSLVQAVIPKQAGIFYEECNIYVPYYRQMSMDGLYLNAEERNSFYSIGYNDIERAFDYYITNLNAGRPFILAGHSQGSQILIQLIKDKFANDKLMKKLVAAYLIGYSVTDEDLSECDWLKIAECADDTRVIITYNTQSETAFGSPVLLPGANCVNPLNWTRTNEYAPKELNTGAVFCNANGEVDSTVNNFTDARIDENAALIAETPDPAVYSSAPFPTGVYHKLDYSFFFNNLKENVTIRINSYFK